MGFTLLRFIVLHLGMIVLSLLYMNGLSDVRTSR